MKLIPILTACLALAAGSVRADVFLVTTTTNFGPGSLRQAIVDANASPGHDFIHFEIPTTNTVNVIETHSQLPVITETVTIDGLTQPGSLPNTLGQGFNATNLVTLTGYYFTNSPPPEPEPGGDPTTNANHGLEIRADAVTIRGLRLVSFIVGGNSTNMMSAIFMANGASNVVESCVFGTNPNTDIGDPNHAAITATNCSFVRIGGTTAAQRNLMASNPGWQMRFMDGVSNVVEGNFVGQPGRVPAALIAPGVGVMFERGYGNRVGGAAAGAGNFFSHVGGGFVFNDFQGAVHFRASHTNAVLGNWFGLQPPEVLINLPEGWVPAGLGVSGVSQGVLVEDSRENRIGGPASGERNVIDAGTVGVQIVGAVSSNNVVQGNYFGTHPDGTATNTLAFSPGSSGNGIGIEIATNAHHNLIGGAAAGEGNVMANNSLHGIALSGSGVTDNRVLGNFIGTDWTGTNALPNGATGFGEGVWINGGASGNEIGGPATGEGNVISGNNNHGVRISGSGTETNRVRGNIIGPDVTGTRRLAYPLPPSYPDRGNVASGVRIDDEAVRNQIGGTAAGEGNLISGNLEDGVNLLEISEGGSTTENVILGNIIGAQIGGTLALPNDRSGVWVEASGNYIGGEVSGARNLISGNGGPGIRLINYDNYVQGNFIGTDISGALALSNATHGIEIIGGNQTIGGAAVEAGNVISGNGIHGVLMTGDNAVFNTLLNNFIGTTADGTAALPNGGDGVQITGNASQNSIGAIGQGNVISGNANHGVAILATISFTTITENNSLLHNRIGVNAAGTASLPNGSNGVHIAVAPGSLLENNLISGNLSHGVYLSGVTNGTLYTNLIGTDLTGTNALPNGGEGVLLEDASNVLIGGTDGGQGNRIAFNTLNGILVRGSGSAGNSFMENSIEANGGLGINLQPFAEADATVTPNDASDADTGPNTLQNFPLTTSAQITTDTKVNGTLHSTATRSFTIELFASLAADPSGHGEGAIFLGRTNTTTDGSGNAAWSVQASGAYSNYWFAATATDTVTGDTSEFGPAATYTNQAPVIDEQPAAQTVFVKGDTSFSVLAHGTGLLSYQWFKNGVKVSRATNATLALLNIATNLAGNYTVTISNAVGVVTSTPAALVVLTDLSDVLPLAGLYNGLFHEADEVRHVSSGFISFTVRTNASISGKVLLDGQSVGFSGKIKPTGFADFSIPRLKLGKSNLTAQLVFDLDDGSSQVTGSIAAGTNWTANALADRAFYSNTNLATNYQGRYTFLLPGGTNAADAPPGDSYGLVTVSTNGKVALSGGLADGQAWRQGTVISKEGAWPHYAPLYKTTLIYTNLLTGLPATNKSYYTGSTLGWITFTNGSLEGPLHWSKPAGWTNTTLYFDGFTHEENIAGSPYTPPLIGERMVAITNGTFTLSDGDLSAPLIRSVTVATNNKVTVSITNQFVKITLTPKTGLLNGSFQHPEVTNRVTKFVGAVLQNENRAGGSFPGTNQTGKVTLEAAP